jgi:predicted GH43/DUF377 family glycosyl hydrolase
MELVYTEDSLKDKSGFHQVMMGWEKPYMEYSIEKLNPYGSVLEIGFGLGYSATCICKNLNVTEYTVIECSPTVWEKFEEWEQTQQRVGLKINLVKGRWQDVLYTLGVFDCIYFDDYNFEGDTHRFKTFINHSIKSHVKIGTRVSNYSTINETEATDPCISFQCYTFDIEIPKDCHYARGDKLYVPVYTFGMNLYKIFPNLVKTILNEGGGQINSIIIDDFENTKGTGFCNASVLKVGDKIMINVRHVEYTFFYSQKFQSKFEGPLSYYHRDDDLSLRTNNYLGELNPDTLQIENYKQVDMSAFDTAPKWQFIGLEDARIVNWSGKIYLVGVRRDTTTNGQGRMEFSEIENFKEVSRTRIEVPNVDSYCEKNWMPIHDKPFHFVKWTNPTEIVKVDLENGTSEQVYLGKQMDGFKYDLRGGTSVIRWDADTYIAITHECYFIPKNNLGHKDAIYKHRFILWDNNFNIKLITRPFDFMTGVVEFCIGMEQINETEVVLVFGFYDSCCYAVKCLKEYINKLIWLKLQNS